MSTSGSDSERPSQGDTGLNGPGTWLGAPRRGVKNAVALHRRGPGSLVNLSIYAAGLSGLWTALGTPLLPIRVEEIVGDGGSTVLGFTFDDDDKNGALGIVSLIGLGAAALTQPIAGMLSDRRSGGSKRLPFLLIGAVGMAASVMFLGFAGTLIALMLLNLLIQGMGNFGQGAANGLIADHVEPGNKGSAAGALNLSRVLGAAILTGIVLLMMRQYDSGASPGWLTAALAVIAVSAILSTLWTVTSLRGAKTLKPETGPAPTEAKAPERASAGSPDSAIPHNDYFRFLVALTFVITGFSALQLYSFFYLEDVIGLERPEEGGIIVILATTSLATALTVLPAGKLTDRVGRDPMIYFAAALGVIATLILIFAGSIIVVALAGLLIGTVIGIFLTVSWALANDLVSRRNAARDLGYASIAALIGSALSRISGMGVDRLNQVQDALGYQVVLGAVAVCFVITAMLMTRLARKPGTEFADALAEQQPVD